mmetsp:Transcript_15384/g.22853  ORF Transcript_15384/g.22853 Transcript_15384/m.22853 type:complete len:335 (+) Transcript_15384:140-1144(+)
MITPVQGILLFTLMVLSWLLSSSDRALNNILRKMRLITVGLLHMLLSKDKKSKLEYDPSQVELDSDSVSKRLILIRHGESEWNEVFNRGFDISFIFRLISALVREVIMLSTRDSVFFDSPLSDTGIRQAQELVRFMEKPTNDQKLDEIISVLNGEKPESSIIVTSNLRRAVATGLLSLWDRLTKTREPYYVVSCLQEMTFNVDGVSLLERKEAPNERVGKELGFDVRYDSQFNYGTKSLQSNGSKRMGEFCDWLFTRKEKTIICNGHSLYFKEFFRKYLPLGLDHEAKRNKIVNCGVVSLVLQKGKIKNKIGYKIDPESITVVYGGFEKKKRKH